MSIDPSIAQQIQEARVGIGAARRIGAVSRPVRPKRTGQSLYKILAAPAAVIAWVLVFAAPDPVMEKFYSRVTINQQIAERLGKPVGTSGYVLHGIDPFPAPEAGHDLAISIEGNGIVAAAASKGRFTLHDGAIRMLRPDSVTLLSTGAVGSTTADKLKGMASWSLLSAPIDIIGGYVDSGKAVNAGGAVQDTVATFPVFIVPGRDRMMFEHGGVEDVAVAPDGYTVRYSDGISIIDWTLFIIASAASVLWVTSRR